MALIASQYYSNVGTRLSAPWGSDLWSKKLRGYKAGHARIEVLRVSKSMRTVVEHVVLLQMKENLTEEQETTMLDNIYTLQYYFGGILCVSLGRLISENQRRCTHGIVMRFASKELLLIYNGHPAHSNVAKEFVLPYCDGFITADFEAAVEDNLEPLFRRGEEFESGIEHIILLKVREQTLPERVDDMLQSILKLAELPSQILVQLTAGPIFSSESQGYTHAIVARFPSDEAMEAFNKHETYVSVFSEKVIPICSEILSTDYRVEPIGTTIQQ